MSIDLLGMAIVVLLSRGADGDHAAAQKAFRDAKGDVVEAMIRYRDEHEQDEFAWLHLAFAYEESHRMSDAGTALEAAVALAPDEPLLRIHEARLSARLGDRNRAAKLYRKAAALYGDSPSAARARAQATELERAVESCDSSWSRLDRALILGILIALGGMWMSRRRI